MTILESITLYFIYQLIKKKISNNGIDGLIIDGKRIFSTLIYANDIVVFGN